MIVSYEVRILILDILTPVTEVLNRRIKLHTVEVDI